VPKQIGSGYMAIAAGGNYTIALKSDGSLWAWGYNGFGQLGDGTTTTSQQVPKQIGSGYMAISAGDYAHTIALKSDGSLWAWGNNSFGQLGDDTTIDSHVPKQIGSGYMAIAAGGNYTIALKSDNSLWTWGNNSLGQLGDGTTINSHVPKQIGIGYMAISAGYTHNIAIKTGGSLWAWGFNTNGQIGDGTTIDRLVPKLIDTGYALISYQDLWWNPNESGWGMSITQHNSMIFAALYTYDEVGQPAWYVMSSCPVSVNSCTGDIYKVSGGTSPTVPWNGRGKVVSSAGTGTLTFTDLNNGTFSYILNSISGSKAITRQLFGPVTTPPIVDYTDLWWNPNESGWGVALSQQFSMIFAAWFTYDATGKAIWYVASSCPVVGSGCTGDLYQVTGGTAVTSVWDGSNKVVTKVGSVNFAFTDASNGTMNYSINGVAGNRVITREGF
jgi:hypothetical protein